MIACTLVTYCPKNFSKISDEFLDVGDCSDFTDKPRPEIDLCFPRLATLKLS